MLINNYVEVAYKETEKPFGEYPFQLAGYLARTFHLKEGMAVLDNGCGRGEFLHAFARLGLKASGTDASGCCREAETVDLNKERLPYPDHSFHAVFSKSVIEHIEDTGHYMSEMKRVLKKGGRIILMTPDWETQYKIFYQDPTHIHPYTVKSMERILEMYGFRNIKSGKFVQLPQTWDHAGAAAVSGMIRKMGPVNKIYKNKFIRFSRELMVLGSGVKGEG